MQDVDIVRAWKDEAYRAGLSNAELALLPDNPAGTIELSDADLTQVAGGTVVTLDTVCISLRICTLRDDCPSVIYTLCGSSPVFCCTPPPV